ncbi:MAG: Ppx/GppA phosphatase family protein [Cardiobacteriaceae bacterium]|nr:Ppx/GppA phosphatase family protein [Cardiobacteriaceae bacterium]
MNPFYAALDLGSNSFHLLVIREDGASMQTVDAVKHMVRLGEGLGEDGFLSAESMARGLAALTQMSEILRDIPREHVRVVATNTLRVAENGADFLRAGEAALGFPIEIISGEEEARLIYLGITAHNHFKDRNLVIDVGGGSTEIIVGDGHAPVFLRSLKMGCANMAQQFFPKGKITRQAIKKAQKHAGQMVEPFIRQIRKQGFERVILSSGTAKAVEKILGGEGVSAAQLEALLERLEDIGEGKRLPAALGVAEERAFGFAGGVCIFASLFEHLGIDRALVSQQALREGVILDLMGRSNSRDERDATVATFITRFNIAGKQAARVKALALALQQSLPDLAAPRFAPLLAHVADLHEIGLAVSHSKQHVHGAYLLENADMPGFSRLMQQMMALLVKGQRKKLSAKHFDALPGEHHPFLWQYLRCLRLAILICRARAPLVESDYPRLAVQGKRWILSFPPGYLDARPLTVADLQEEQQYWAQHGECELLFV